MFFSNCFYHFILDIFIIIFFFIFTFLNIFLVFFLYIFLRKKYYFFSLFTIEIFIILHFTYLCYFFYYYLHSFIIVFIIFFFVLLYIFFEKLLYKEEIIFQCRNCNIILFFYYVKNEFKILQIFINTCDFHYILYIICKYQFFFICCQKTH